MTNTRKATARPTSSRMILVPSAAHLRNLTKAPTPHTPVQQVHTLHSRHHNSDAPVASHLEEPAYRHT